MDDRKQGIFKEYDAKGNLKEMVKYDAGVVDAGAQDKLTVDIKRTFHPNGRVASLGSYSKSGKKEGLVPGVRGTDGIGDTGEDLSRGPTHQRGSGERCWGLGGTVDGVLCHRRETCRRKLQGG